MTPDEIRSRAAFFAKTKRDALGQLGDLGPRGTVELFIRLLRGHADLAGEDRLFALTHLEATQMVIPGGSPAVRAWIEAYPWPGRLKVES